MVLFFSPINAIIIIISWSFTWKVNLVLRLSVGVDELLSTPKIELY